jgi:hypothetical protein
MRFVLYVVYVRGSRCTCSRHVLSDIHRGVRERGHDHVGDVCHFKTHFADVACTKARLVVQCDIPVHTLARVRSSTNGIREAMCENIAMHSIQLTHLARTRSMPCPLATTAIEPELPITIFASACGRLEVCFRTYGSRAPTPPLPLQTTMRQQSVTCEVGTPQS